MDCKGHTLEHTHVYEFIKTLKKGGHEFEREWREFDERI